MKNAQPIASRREAIVSLGALTLAAASLSATGARAQLAPQRTFEELKTEIQARADRKAYPVAQLDAAEVREALVNLKSMDRDHWASVWGAIGDRHLARAKGLEASDKKQAAEAYDKAMQWYMFARFPLEDSPGTAKAYEKALEAFAGYSRLVDPPIEAVKFTYEGKEVTGYLPSAVSTAARRMARSATPNIWIMASPSSPSTCRAPGRRVCGSSPASRRCSRPCSTSSPRDPISTPNGSS